MPAARVCPLCQRPLGARVEDQLYVYADRDIEPGEEITADYRTFNLVPEGKRCWCENPQCVI